VNILFVNYGDFTTNSLNHIAGFAGKLCAEGHACAVAVPGKKESLSNIPDAVFVAITYDEVLANPGFFPDGRPADLIHAWTPREGVRKFVVAYQRLQPTRLVVHLEDNEEFLVSAFMGESLETLRQQPEENYPKTLVDGLPHPVRYKNLLRLADGVTVITDSLRSFVPPGPSIATLPPGVDFTLYFPQLADQSLRQKIGLKENEKAIVFTGSTTFANEAEMRELYLAVKILNKRGTPTRLVRTGINSPKFQEQLPPDWKDWTIDLGFVEKPLLPKLLALSDVLVQPGHLGAFNDYRLPSKLPEFFASGRPVILPATNLAADLRDGVDALLLRTGTPEEIADACERVFKDSQLAETLGRNAVAFAKKHYDLAANTARLRAFYSDVSSRPANPAWQTLRESPAADASLLAANFVSQLKAQPGVEAAAWQDTLRLAEDISLLCRQLEATAGNSDNVVNSLRTRLETERDEWKRVYELTQQHVKNIEPALAASRTHTENLTAELKRLEGRQAVNERLIAASRRQIEALDGELAAARRNIAEHEKSARLTKEHVSNLEQAQADLQKRVRELDEQCDHLSRTIDAREDVIKQRDLKIRTMQRSFSWQVTAPFRALRRLIFDAKAAPKLSDKIEGRVDYPHDLEHIPPTLHLRGWAFHRDKLALRAMRARIGKQVVSGEYGLERLDVLDHFRDQPGAEHSGWVVKVEVPALLASQLVLEVQDEAGNWHPFFSRSVRRTAKAAPPPPNSYGAWVAAYDTLTAEDETRYREKLKKLQRQPLISVLMPTYNTPAKWLTRAIDSVRAQYYENWELCIADDASKEPHVRPLLEKYQKLDKRIKIVFRESNGHISAASNSALAIANGEFIALFDHDDELRPHALACVALELDRHPDADLVYSDEDKIDENGQRYDHYFKPDWNPDLFLVQNFVSHLGVYRTLLVREVGGFRVGYEGSQDWDLAMRVVERTAPDRIRHIPKVLYHWRSVQGSTAMLMSAKSYAVTAAEKVITEHFSRTGIAAKITPTKGHYWRVHYPLPKNPPRVTLIIPTRNRLNVLRPCIESLLGKTSYPNFEILVIDNDSNEADALGYLEELRASPRCRVVRFPGDFNYSAINNFGVSQTDAPVIGLLNNDLEVIHPDWLDEMVSYALRPEIGCVGAKLYYPTDRIQHAGVILGIGGVAAHAWQTHLRGTHGQAHRAILQQNLSAVTAACLVVRREVFLQAGGFDEKLGVAFNDVDFCLSVRKAGYRNFWTPFAELYHHESASRGAEDTLEKRDRFRREVEYIQSKWGDALFNDPAYNPNLTLTINDFTLATPPRATAAWDK
jgi:GT2 family glycosyltransferase/glycosyltransferase involved in cell wall biosynthesis/phage shock protein A